MSARPDDVWDVIISNDVTRLSSMLAADKKLVELCGGGGQSPLHLACECGDGGMVKALLQAGASLQAEDETLRTPLLVASEVGAAAAIECCVESGAALNVADENGNSPLHWLACHGLSALIALAISKEGAEIDAVNTSQQTPLHMAIVRGHLACALVLIDAGASVRAEDTEKRCAMHLAMQYSGGLGACSESTLLLLRLLQVDPKTIHAKDADRRTPLHWACGKNALPCVKALIGAGADINGEDWAGRTPVHWAVLVDAADSAAELLKAGANGACADRDKRTPLHWAADRASESCVKLLLAKSAAGAHVDDVDWGGYSSLHHAARRGASGCIRLLLDAGANRRLVAMNGELPFDVADEPAAKKMLAEGVGLKRQRSLSSGNQLVMLGVLPNLARQFYDAWPTGDVKPYVTEDLSAACRAALAVAMRHKDVAVEEMHVCTRTSKVVVECVVEGVKSMHSLTFSDEGLISCFVPYTQTVPAS